MTRVSERWIVDVLWQESLHHAECPGFCWESLKPRYDRMDASAHLVVSGRMSVNKLLQLQALHTYNAPAYQADLGLEQSRPRRDSSRGM